MNSRTLFLCFLISTSATAVSAEVEQRAGPVRPIEEVVVTAQKREQSVQDVSLAVTAYSAEELELRGIDDAFDLSFMVPNFSITRFGRGQHVLGINIRSIGNFDGQPINFTSTSLYVDEILQPSGYSGVFQQFDLERAEVLKGPQGTLFGGNSTAGLVHFITRKPSDDFGGYARVKYGDYEDRTVEGAVGGPISERIRARIAGKYAANDGFQKNPVTGVDRFGEIEEASWRATLAVDLADEVEMLLNVHGSEEEGYLQGHQFWGRLAPGNLPIVCPDSALLAFECVDFGGNTVPPHDTDTTYAPELTPTEAKNKGGYVKFAWEPQWGQFVSVTGYEDTDSFFIEPLDTSTVPFGAPALTGLRVGDSRSQTRESFSQELRVSGARDNVSWLFGAYYYEDEATLEFDIRLGPSLPTSGTINNQFIEVQTVSRAIFAQLEAGISETLTFVVGARFTDEEREVSRFASATTPFFMTDAAKLESTPFTGRLALEWRPTTDLLGYVQFSRGFKSGAFTPNSSGDTAPDALGPVTEEILNSWEIGIKSSWMGGRLIANGAAFYYDFNGLQALVAESTGSTLSTRFLNIEGAKVVGADLEFSLIPVDNLSLYFNLGLLDSEVEAASNIFVSGIPIDGNELARAPSYSLAAGINYDIPLENLGVLTLRVDGTYQGKEYFGFGNRGVDQQADYGVLNLNAVWRSPNERYSVRLYAENVTDELYYTSALAFDAVGEPATFLSNMFRDAGFPRTYGVALGVDF